MEAIDQQPSADPGLSAPAVDQAIVPVEALSGAVARELSGPIAGQESEGSNWGLDEEGQDSWMDDLAADLLSLSQDHDSGNGLEI